MKLIAIEEHFLTAEIRAAWASSAIGQEGTAAFDRGEIEERLDDLGQGPHRSHGRKRRRCSGPLRDHAGPAQPRTGRERRLSRNAPTIWSPPPSRNIPHASRASPLCPPPRRQALRSNLNAACGRLGFAGAMLCGRTRDKNLDHPDFLPIFETAAKLGVPVFIHPQIPQRAVRERLLLRLRRPDRHRVRDLRAGLALRGRHPVRTVDPGRSLRQIS